MATVHITPPPLSSQSMADLLCTIMILCRGKQENNISFWAYMCIKPSMAKAFKDAREAGAFNLEDFGTVIEWGEEIDPPADVMARMEKDYGMNHHYEEELIAAIESHKNEYNE